METFALETGVPKKQNINALREKLTASRLIMFNIIIGCVIVIFIWSDSVRLASSPLTLYKDDSTIYSESFYLTISRSMATLWHSSSYVMSTIIFIFSFVFPYIGLLTLLLFIWYKIKVSTRNSVFHILDLIAKLPLINVFFLMCFANILSQDISFTLLQADYIGTITVDLNYGLIIFTLSTLTFMIMTLILNYYDNDTFISESLSAMFVDDEEDSSWSKCNQPLLFYPQINCKKLMTLITLIITFAFAMAMYSTTFFTVKFMNGMADYMMHPTRSYSIIDIGMFNVYNLFNVQSGIMVYLSVIYSILVIIIPILLLLSLFVVWLIPLPKMFKPTDIRYYLWCLLCLNGLEVIWIITLFILFEFPSLYNYLLFDQHYTYCQEYESYLDDTCADLEITAGAGFWLCLITIIGLYIVTHYTVFASHDDANDKSDVPAFTGTNTEEYMAYSEAQPLNDKFVE